MENEKIELVVCYIRVSTQEQKLHGISLDSQRDILRSYAEKHGLKIVGWYEDEGVSGRKLIKNRPALQRMLKDAQAGKFNRILFIKLDRFFRSVAEYHECMKLIEPVIWTATEEKYDLSTANGRAFVNMKLTIAELEADQTGERINLVNDYKVKTGQPLTGANSQGLAYTVTRDEKTGVKSVTPDPETKELVTDFINHFLTHQSLTSAILYVNTKYGTKYEYPVLQRVLRDTKIYGHYRGNDNYCEPYVDKATYDKIQDRLNSNIRTRKNKRVYLFSGLICCPVCGRKMCGITSCNRKTIKPNGKVYVNDKEIPQYRCNKAKMSNLCTFKKYPNEGLIEKMLLSNFSRYVKSHITNVTVEAERNKHADGVKSSIVSIQSEMNRLNVMYRKGRLKEAEYDRDYEALELQLTELQSSLTPVEERDVTVYEELLATNDWKALYNALTKENQRAFWHKYIKAIKLDADGKVDEVIFF